MHALSYALGEAKDLEQKHFDLGSSKAINYRACTPTGSSVHCILQ